jgi:hypothetical protein
VLGLWLGGYTGAILCPAATLVFLAAGRRAAGDSRGPGVAVSRVLHSRWLVAALVVAAAVGSAAGTRLLDTGALTTAVTNSGPQLLCLVVVARIAAALVRSGDISESGR